MTTKLKNLISSKGLRQVDIAKELDINPPAVCAYVNGYVRIPRTRLHALSKMLGMKPSNLESLLKNGRAV